MRVQTAIHRAAGRRGSPAVVCWGCHKGRGQDVTAGGGTGEGAAGGRRTRPFILPIRVMVQARSRLSGDRRASDTHWIRNRSSGVMPRDMQGSFMANQLVMGRKATERQHLEQVKMAG
jgi:hypothetical protein